MILWESPSADPYFNLALEQVLFEGPGRERACCMLWRNDRTIVVGKYQNTLQEVDLACARRHGIRVARRLSGGGAVYHDLGNVNFTFVAPHQGAGMDFAAFCRPVAAVLAELGVEAAIGGRNDMTVEGKKFSGSAQYVKAGRVMHHGTILYDSDLTMLGKVLRPPEDKYVSRGLPSVRGRVTNLRPYVKGDLDADGFLARLRRGLLDRLDMEPAAPGPAELARAEELRRTVYSTWDWNFGASPPCQAVKQRRVEGCGRLEVRMDVEKGRVKALRFFGDFFSLEEPAELAERLTGCPLEAGALRERLAGTDVGRYFRGLDGESLLRILTE